jgi:hypothetical protein
MIKNGWLEAACSEAGRKQSVGLTKREKNTDRCQRFVG